MLLIHNYIERKLAIVDMRLTSIEWKYIWISSIFEKSGNDLEKTETACILQGGAPSLILVQISFQTNRSLLGDQ